MGKKVGLACKLYYNSGTYASPTWVEIEKAKDVELNLEAGEADATDRGSGGWREFLAALKDASIEFEINHDSSDAGYVALRTAFFASTNAIEILALEGDVAVAGNEGLRATCAVFGFSRSEPLDSTVSESLSLKPTPNDDSPPEWYTSS